MEYYNGIIEMYVVNYLYIRYNFEEGCHGKRRKIKLY